METKQKKNERKSGSDIKSKQNSERGGKIGEKLSCCFCNLRAEGK